MPVRAGHKFIGLALEVSDYSEPGPVSRCRLERLADLVAPTFHHRMGFPCGEVCAARILLPSVLGRKDPVQMIMVEFTARLSFVNCEMTIRKAHLFAFSLFHIAMRCT